MAIKTVLIKNPNIIDNEITRLTKRYTGGLELNVENGEGFSVDDFIIAGKPGFERTEKGKVDASTSLVLTLESAFSFPHDQDTPVFYTKFDQIVLEYQSASGGAWTQFSDMPKDIEWDDLYSQYITADGNYYAFRWRFKNSVTGQYSSYSPTMPAGGWARTSGAKMVEKVRRIIKDKKGDLATDEEILDLLDDGQQHLKEVRKKWWFLKVDPPTFTSTVASTSKYAVPADCDFIEKVMFKYTSGTIEEVYRLRFKNEAEFDTLQADQNQDDDDEASYWTLRAPDATSPKGYVEIYPKPATAAQAFKIVYYKDFTTIDSAGDATECPRPEALEYHAAAIILGDNDREEAANRNERRRDKVINELQANNKRVATNGSFLTFRGQRGYSKLHQRGSRLNRDLLHTNYFNDEYRS